MLSRLLMQGSRRSESNSLQVRLISTLLREVESLKDENRRLKMSDTLARAKASLPGEDVEVTKMPPYEVVPCPLLRLQSKVVAGFGRGAKDLGCPTANMEKSSIGSMLDNVDNGVYAGWATVGSRGPYKTVASIGFNPTYEDVKEKIVEPHLIHRFDKDFYGETLRFVICGYLRPQWKFVDEDTNFNYPLLIEAIQSDVKLSEAALDDPIFQQMKTDSFLGANKL